MSQKDLTQGQGCQTPLEDNSRVNEKHIVQHIQWVPLDKVNDILVGSVLSSFLLSLGTLFLGLYQAYSNTLIGLTYLLCGLLLLIIGLIVYIYFVWQKHSKLKNGKSV